ncbi:MAG TPA: right-handed parallel beta-helix repeat-containing protein [Polyangia bacterium]|nr:right-handed parallel beta-helix repeat-containing protein [Polyangia bacterium]
MGGGARGGSAGSANGGGAGGGGSATQGTYYVSPSGSDTNPGSVSAPFLTVAKARDVVRTVNGNMNADIAVYLRGGNYPVAGTIAFAPADSGTNGHRIVYQAYPGEAPVLNGATKVTGWSVSSGNVYKAALARSTKLRNLYVNDARASLTKKTVTSQGGTGTYAVTAGQASWAWTGGSNSDGAKYKTADVPAIAANKDDLEIMNGTTWNENIVCVRDVVTTSDGYRGLLFQQPYGAIAQLPGWSAGFSVSGTHTIYNAFELLNAAGQFYFDKSAGTLYYYPRTGENMATADVEAPVVETIIAIAGTSNTSRVKNLTFQGITFANTDYGLYAVAGSRGKATVQGATVFVAYGDGNWHNSKYEITDTLPGMIMINNADGISLSGNTIKHSGSEGISMINDVVNATVVGNVISDIAGSGITIGHPQHVYLADTGAHEKYAPGVEGICTNDSITNNVLYDTSSQPGFGGHAGITAFFVAGLSLTNNYINKTAYNGINLGWGWQNFKDSTTCKNNAVNNNRLVNTLNRLHDSGAVYTLGQMPGTTINGNYVKGIPPATSGPTYGLHNDEGSAYITENDNVLDIDPGVKYTINCEDFGAKHDLTIRRTYATVNKMGVNPPNSTIDPPIAVADNVWPATQYATCLSSGIQDAYRAILPATLVSTQDHVFPASCAVTRGTASLGIRSSGDASNVVWFAPAGTTAFAAGATMTKASGTSTSIALPTAAGTYKLHVVDAQGNKRGESAALLRID